MRKTTEGEQVFFFLTGLSQQLKDPDFADDTCLLSTTFVKMENMLMEFSKCPKNCQIADCEKMQSLIINVKS